MKVSAEHSKYSVSYSGVATPIIEVKDNSKNLVKFNGVYRITEAVLCRLKNAELAVYGKGRVLGLNQFLLTLTFPIDFDNARRIEINERFRDAARKQFPHGGMWFTEVHTGKDYKNRKGVLVSGNKEMIGKFHFHYKVITSDDWASVLHWVRKQQRNDGVRNNSYDVSRSGDDLRIYAAAYSAKKEQKAYVMYNHRPWASWGVNKKPIRIDKDTLYKEFSLGMNKEETRHVVKGNDYPCKIFSIKNDLIHDVVHKVKKLKKVKNNSIYEQ